MPNKGAYEEMGDDRTKEIDEAFKGKNIDAKR
jgi:hypothetical protein